MRRILSILALVLALSAHAQVDNYGLRFSSAEGVANLGRLLTFAPTDGYTLQFWFCADEWTKAAPVVRCGTFSIKLGNEHAIVLNDGNRHLTITDAALETGKWCHVTVRSSYLDDKTTVTLNNGAKHILHSALALQAMDQSLWLGGGFIGRIDEVRLWRDLLPEDYESFYANTLNIRCPSWNKLTGYWKMDQEQCPNLVNSKTTKYNGTLSSTGVTKEKITDNPLMKYRIQLGYGNIERYFDRTIDADHYGMLSNHVSIIGCWTYNDGTAKLYSANDAGTPSEGAEYLAERDGRSGVLSLTTAAATMTMPASALPSDATAWTIECWVLVDDWTEGALVLQKKQSDSKEVSIRLGTEGNFIGSLNGKEVTLATGSVGKWTHLAMTNSTFGSTAAIGLGTAELVVGEGLKGCLDDILVWTATRSASEITSDASALPIPGPKVQMSGQQWKTMAAAYDFSKEQDLGFDRYSVQGYIDHMRQLAGNRRGAKYIVTAAGPADIDGTMSNATKRTAMGKALAAIANDPYFDGLDIDFEWTYTATGWENIAKMLHICRQNMQQGKILSVSPHNVTYAYPTSYMSDIDYFNFQQYGPQSTHSEWNTFVSYAQKFVSHGFPKDKIVLSYSTTTCKGSNGTAIQGYRYISDGFKDDTNSYTNASGETFYINSLNQVKDRTQYVRDNDLGGIMYWDMGNDRPSNDAKSYARASSMILAANTDILVTQCDTAACAPADDETAPVATIDPDDWGGTDQESRVLQTVSDVQDNRLALNIINVNGLGILYASGSDNVWLAESSNANFSQTVDHNGQQALWHVLYRQGRYFIYNIARQQFVQVPNFNVTSQACTFSDTPAPLSLTRSAAGKFAFREYGSTAEKGYMCASPQISDKPVCQWTISDSGSQWQLVTVPLFTSTAGYEYAEAQIDAIYGTGIEVVSSEADRVYYDLQGRRLTQAPRHGIYVVNGRKVVR